ncbi:MULTISPECIES: hypothetical protein [unclassified Lysobacter]|uniref:hypothetical protein n=1 Tax=unclassified Lysobacter TaxID=2635362 RepID=UPI001F5AE9F1|nr:MULTISPECIES: hypothetical protein [unclassified Lysobacter]
MKVMRIVMYAAMLLFCAGHATAQGSRRANARADAWLGRDAGELLLQLRVDGDRVQITENDESGETAYTWSTWNPAWTEEVVTAVDTRPIGATAGGGLLLGQTVYTEDVHHAATHRCDVTFFADSDGVIRRWEYTGNRCTWDIQKPKD